MSVFDFGRAGKSARLGFVTASGALLAALAAAGLPAGSSARGPLQEEEGFARARAAMVEKQVAARGVRSPAVLEALRTVPRHLFIPPAYRGEAYEDHPVPIGDGQTISQPFIVGLMTESLDLRKGEKVLEVGTGSGYQAAVLSLLAGDVFTVEINEDLARLAADTLKSLGYGNVHVRCGDGFFGWPEEAPFDAVIVTCAVERVPPPLLDQLRDGGRLIIPLGDARAIQTLTLITKRHGRAVVRRIIDVRFVPMTGEVQKKR
jgi:protein-L-isoaspartate(D-aspartate) O-methyltransferase